MARFLDLSRRFYRWFRVPIWLGLGLAIGFLGPYLWYLDRLVRAGFDGLRFDTPSRVYARALELRPGRAMDAETLLLELQAARYSESTDALQPGSYARDGARFLIQTRAFVDGGGAQPSRRIRVALADGRVGKLEDVAGKRALEVVQIDPARIATLYGKARQERRLVKLGEVPPLFLRSLLAVEDKDFASHHGIDPWGMARAIFVNVKSGELSQGGSTLTQQLVRNQFLDRRKKFVRKFNEICLALLIEARFGKQAILEAYLNDVYLGQHGSQSVHGVGAAAEFYFGRELETLAPHEMALLVGMIQGPSLFDPRRAPANALKRRNLVLREMHQAGLLSELEVKGQQRFALNVTASGAIARNRYPGFIELVQAQIARDYDAAALASEGLAIHTTLAPSTQQYAERAVAEKIKTLAKDASGLQAAMVVTRAATGAIEAVVGGRDTQQLGFNRAAMAARPIGSLVKPFVYLVALAQPERWSLMSPLSDTAIALRQRSGQTWQPRNSDNLEHGEVALIDALARSYNLATVRLGLDLGVPKVERLLEALIPGADVSPHPSLLLGATELTPLQVAQAYQYLAADGHLLPLSSVTAVIDRNGRAVSRYRAPQGAGELVEAARLVSYAMQEGSRSGTGAALVGLGLGHLHVAGKTGTSDDLRDSWYAGFTGGHLAVVWLGRDDNKRAGLYGATGAMRLWAALFEKLPSEPLQLDLGHNPVVRWIDPQTQRATNAECEGARALPFIRGFEPTEYMDCDRWTLDDWFRNRFTDRDPPSVNEPWNDDDVP
ncbi:MAG: penicillin-binding protein 1B [Xanthomonadales bacterium]|nr:penicillin-binding protein 1B [Xanthomonadales bacterium]